MPHLQTCIFSNSRDFRTFSFMSFNFSIFHLESSQLPSWRGSVLHLPIGSLAVLICSLDYLSFSTFKYSLFHIQYFYLFSFYVISDSFFRWLISSPTFLVFLSYLFEMSDVAIPIILFQEVCVYICCLFLAVILLRHIVFQPESLQYSEGTDYSNWHMYWGRVKGQFPSMLLHMSLRTYFLLPHNKLTYIQWLKKQHIFSSSQFPWVKSLGTVQLGFPAPGSHKASRCWPGLWPQPRPQNPHPDFTFLQVCDQGSWLCGNKDQPKENKQKPLVRSLLEQGNQPPSFALGRDSKAGRGVEKIYSGKGEASVHMCPDWRLLVWGSWKWANQQPAFYVTGQGNIFGFLQLVSSWKEGQNEEAVSY